MKKFVLSGLAALTLALTLALGQAALTDTASADAPLVDITGVVVSRVDEVLVVRTDRGNLTFDLDKSTVMPASLPVGSWITVSYDSDDKPEDAMDARKIVMAAAPTTAAPAPTTPAPVVNTPAPTPAPVVTTQETSRDYTSSEELPATASSFPLMAAAGLLAMAGSYLLRKWARRKATH